MRASILFRAADPEFHPLPVVVLPRNSPASDVHQVWLALAFLPYASLAGFDAWLHEKSRRVPRFEQILHVMAGLFLLLFVGMVFSGHALLAVISLAVFSVAAIVDEFGFHGHLMLRERLIHFASYAALLVFVAVWQWQGMSI